MAQTTEVLDEGLAELVLLGNAEGGTGFTKIVCMTDSVVCTADKAHTHAAPADTLVTDSGLDVANIATVSHDDTNTTGDTMTFDHVFTASASKNVTGIHIVNTDGDCSLVECCFASVKAMENTDTLTIDGEVVLNQAA
jgi:hypothetical protein